MKYLFFMVFVTLLFAQEKEELISGTEKEEQADYELSVGQGLEVRFAGELWIYLEKRNEQAQTVKVERQLLAGETVFHLLFEEPKLYRLRFFRQDVGSGTAEERFLTFNVLKKNTETALQPAIQPLVGKEREQQGQERVTEQQKKQEPQPTIAQPVATLLQVLLEDIEEHNKHPRSMLQLLSKRLKKMTAAEKEQQLLEAAQFFEQAGHQQHLALALSLYRSYAENSNDLKARQRALYRAYLLQRDFVNIN